MAGNLGDGTGIRCAYIIGFSRRALQQDGPQPDRQVGGVKVGAVGRAVALDYDWAAVQAIADEIADGIMGVQWQIRTDEGETAGDLDREMVLAGIKGAEQLGAALAFAIGAPGVCGSGAPLYVSGIWVISGGCLP